MKLRIISLFCLLIIILSACTPFTSNGLPLGPNVDAAAMQEADRYLTMLKQKWAGDSPGSIEQIDGPKSAKVTDYGYELVYDVTFHSGLVLEEYLELENNGDGTFTARAMRNHK